ncbi:MAG: CotH kinase family protein, partial [Anaerovoracaceae bacterium]
FSRGGGGSDLNYVDDDPDSYSTIWEGEVTNTGDSDHQKVIKALKNISQNNDLETYMDVDNLLKYMAVHTFSVNLDSLSGNMAHNYYLYESEGRLNIIPWDYNLSFGGMNMGGGGGGPQNMRPQDDGSSAAGTDAPESSEAADAGAAPGAAAGSSVDSATEMINFPIDSPFESTEFFDGLLENEEYLTRYHEYLRMLCEEYVNGGRYDELMERFHTQIDGLVETDPNALYDYEEYTEATEMLSQVVKLRAESILGQLDGSIPSTEEGQDAQPEALLDASSVDIEVMGTMGGLMNRENGWNNKN